MPLAIDAPEDVQRFSQAAHEWNPYDGLDRLEHGVRESEVQLHRVEDKRDDPLLRGFVIDGVWLVRRRYVDRDGRLWGPSRSMNGVTERWRLETMPPDWWLGGITVCDG